MIARWDGDTRGRGIGDGLAFVPGVSSLIDDMSRPHWIAEDPEIHLLPHLQRVCEAPNSVWTLESAHLHDTIYDVHLVWKHPGGRARELRADMFSLLGSVVESSTHVRERILHDGVLFDVTTGTLDTDSPFQGHGHLLRLHVSR